MNLRERWFALALKYFPHEKAQSVYFELSNHYDNCHRHYHNFSHIADLFNKEEDVTTRIEDQEVVDFAIWFHDVIYQPLRKDNERKSAEFARSRLSDSSFSDERTFMVCDFIQATYAHENPEQIPDLALLLDLDLSILGTSLEGYKVYTRQIRREYRLVPEVLYRSGRKKVLRLFLERPHIYQTPEFRQQFEIQAKENIAWELGSL